MTFRSSAFVTAGLLGALLLAGSFLPAHAGDGCGQGKKGTPTTSSWLPAPVPAI
ncbi:MAG TPA: hypothetical protein VES73_15175 [Lamprocystis sp. (in: g-proteobacteria)]|nr:hypothetical protein [Lamprocystis sp. (in: g-proteobacteria)]